MKNYSIEVSRALAGPTIELEKIKINKLDKIEKLLAEILEELKNERQEQN